MAETLLTAGGVRFVAARILLVDDHRVVREGIRRILEAHEDLIVVGEAGDGQQAIEQATLLEPDVIVLEATLSRLSGIEAVRRIRQVSPRTRCLVLSHSEGHTQVTQSLRAGAVGYVVKTASGHELVEAVRATALGQSYLSPSIAHFAVDAIAQPGSADSPVALLTGREREVLQLIAEGLSSKEIASLLGVSLKTVDTHRCNLMGKLKIRKASKLVRVAIHEGLIAL